MKYIDYLIIFGVLAVCVTMTLYGDVIIAGRDTIKPQRDDLSVFCGEGLEYISGPDFCNVGGLETVREYSLVSTYNPQDAGKNTGTTFNPQKGL